MAKIWKSNWLKTSRSDFARAGGGGRKGRGGKKAKGGKKRRKGA